MRIAFNQTSKNRKKMVEVISTAISTPKKYAGTPTYAFIVGAFTVTRDGTLEFDSAGTDEEQIIAVINALHTAGFDCKGSESISIGYPAGGFTDEAFANLEKMVASKAPLIKIALDVDELPIKRGETEIIFPWFRAGLSREETHGYAQFITQLCQTAKGKKRVTASERDFTNPRFSFRVWLISLGMVGTDFSQVRRTLCKALPGNAAWSSGIDPRRKVKTKASETASITSDTNTISVTYEIADKAN